MAAFAVENSNKTWQRVKAALAGANPAAVEAFAQLKMYLATQKKNIDLQFLPFTAAQAAAAGGTVLGSGTGTVYGWYVKKTATATQNTIKLYDDATDDTTAGNAIAAADLRAASTEVASIRPTGQALATGLVVTAHTTLLGTTDGSSANAGSGFVIIGS